MLATAELFACLVDPFPFFAPAARLHVTEFLLKIGQSNTVPTKATITPPVKIFIINPKSCWA